MKRRRPSSWRGLILAALAASPLACSAGNQPVAATTLCDAADQAYFACKTASGRLINLCGQYPQRLQYLYGRPGRLELAYPEAAAGGPEKLSYAHYVRPDTDYTEIGFARGEIAYAVFDYREGSGRTAGVAVTLADGSERRFECATPIESQLQIWSGVLRCDPDNALTGGQCPAPSKQD